MKTLESPKISPIAAWIIVLGASLLPKIIPQEIFHLTVSFTTQTIISFCLDRHWITSMRLSGNRCADCVPF